jgi:large subunit ribosomal protein L24e
MPRTRECDYCGDDIEPGTGTMFVAVDGSITHFCSSKCESNSDLGRDARDLEWTGGDETQEEQRTEAESEPEPESESEPEPEEAASEDEETETEVEGEAQA